MKRKQHSQKAAGVLALPARDVAGVGTLAFQESPRSHPEDGAMVHHAQRGSQHHGPAAL